MPGKFISATRVDFPLLFKLPPTTPWSGALSDHWQMVGRWLVVILVGASVRRAPGTLWVFAFVSEMLRAQLAHVPVNG